MARKYSNLALYALLILFGWLSFLVVRPFFNYILMGLVFAFLFYPVYKFFARVLPESLASTVVLIITLLLIIVPSIYLAGSLISQASQAYQLVQSKGIVLIDETSLAEYIQGWSGVDIQEEIVELFRQGRQAIKDAIPGLITSTGSFLLGLFILFFVMYYALKDGKSWYDHAIEAFPLGKEHRSDLKKKLWLESRALLYGHLMTSVLVGSVIGVMFWIVDIPNPVFWGFVMVIIGIVPILGAPLVYLPASIFLLVNGRWIAGISLLIVASAFQLVTDNILRPKLISKASDIHPVLVIVGAIGGILVMGVVGFIVGPLVLSLFLTLLSFDYDKKK